MPDRNDGVPEHVRRAMHPSLTEDEIKKWISDQEKMTMKNLAKKNDEWAALAKELSTYTAKTLILDSELRMLLRIAEDAILQRGPFAPIKEDISGLRPCVFVFASAMENKLRKHDNDRGKEGWRDGTFTPVMAYLRMKAEMEELEAALSNNHGNPNMRESRQEAVDVANFAMMLWDLCLTMKKG